MKKALFTVLAMTFVVPLFAQKNPLKYKSKPKKIQYYYLPEFHTLWEHKSYKISFEADGATYKPKRKDGKSLANWQIGIKSTYIAGKNWCTKDCSLSIKITTTEQTIGEKTVSQNQEKVTNADGSVSQPMLYNYEIESSQLAHVVVVDNLSGNTLIDDTIRVDDAFDYPKDLGGYPGCHNEAALKRQYNTFTNKSDYLKLRNKAMLQDAVEDEIGVFLQRSLGCEREAFTLYYEKIKTKDERFADYMRGCDLMEDALGTFKFVFGENIPTNSHDESTFEMFNEAYQLLSKYNYEYVLEILGNESFAKEFVDKSLVPLFISAVFSSRYEKATGYYETAINNYLGTSEGTKLDDPSQVKQAFNSAFGSIKDDLRAFNSSQGRISILVPALLHEVKTYEKFKTQYGYYK